MVLTNIKFVCYVKKNINNKNKQKIIFVTLGAFTVRIHADRY